MPVVDNAPVDQKRKHDPIVLLIENEGGKMGPDPSGLMDWDRVVWGMDGREDTATIRVALSSKDLGGNEPVGDRHFGHIIGPGPKVLLHPDRKVWIQQMHGDDPPTFLFEGYPMVSTIRWSASAQQLTVTCQSRAQEELRYRNRMQTVGRWMHLNREAFTWDKDDYLNLTVAIPSMPAHFNVGGQPNRTQASYTFPVSWGGGEIELYLFTEDGAPNAQKWSYFDALRYQLFWDVINPKATGDLLAFDVQAFFDDTDRLVGKQPGGPEIGNNNFDRLGVQPVEDERADATDVLSIITMLVQRAGLHFQTAIKAEQTLGGEGDPIHYLRVFPPVDYKEKEGEKSVPPTSFTMGWPAAHPIPREAPFTDLAAHGGSFHAWSKANAAQNATITLDDKIINSPLYMGGIKEYEVTLYLIPGWIPFDLEHYDSDYPGLVNRPTRNVLDNVSGDVSWKPSDEESRAIRLFWDTLPPTKDPDTGEIVIATQFDRRHPQHSVVADVGRKWIYPMDARYGSAENGLPATSPYWRTYGKAPNQYISDSPERLTYNAFSALGGGEKDEVNRLTDFQYGGGISAARRWAARARIFHSPITRFPGGSRLDRYLEIKVGGDPFEDTDWHRYTGPAFQVSPTESAIHVNLNDVRGISTAKGEGMIGGKHHDLENWWIWIARQILFMRITVKIDSDHRLFHQVELGNPELMTRQRAKVIDLGERFQFRDRGRELEEGKGQTTNSILAKRMPDIDPDENFESIDEQERLEEYAKEEAKAMRKQNVSGDPEIPWITYDYAIGDTFTGVAGIGIDEFNTPPEIVSISFENREQGGYRTKLMLADIRHDPTLLLDE